MSSFASFGSSLRAGVVLYFTMFIYGYFCMLTDPQKLKCGKQTPEHGNKFYGIFYVDYAIRLRVRQT
eukprot:SAG11_NODE_320_length_10806_cov_17.415896_2_plen_67_part_00